MKIALPGIVSLVATVVATVASSSASAGPLWRIDFQHTTGTTPPPPPVMAGDEPLAAAADPLFAPNVSSAWDAVDVPPGPTGTPDSINAILSIIPLTLWRNGSGVNVLASGGPTNGPQVDDRLDRDGIGPSTTPTLVLNFTMPKANQPYRFAIYDPQSSNFTRTQYLLNGVVVGELTDNDQEYLGADAPLIATGVSDATGLIRLALQNAPSTFGFPGIAGVQIAEAPIPEPSALALLAMGGAATCRDRRQRR